MNRYLIVTTAIGLHYIIAVAHTHASDSLLEPVAAAIVISLYVDATANGLFRISSEIVVCQYMAA